MNRDGCGLEAVVESKFSAKVPYRKGEGSTFEVTTISLS